ncbi:MAG: hypothetical protein GY862_28730, partial [Gammaproteobacteria bacterium]|nr:hypothetical protein [Gammaproteobacteria bacterium]
NHACYITFSVGDKIERVDRKMPSYLIEHAKQTSWMDRLVTALFDTPARATAGTAATKRGDVDELIMPLFVKLPREKYLIAGRHELFLTWKGGLAPYKVRIYRDDDTLLFERIEIPSADKPVRLVFSKPLFTAGKHYLLEIQSAWQCTDKVKDPGLCITEGRFKAVAAAGFPVLPDEPGSLSEHARRVRLAAWLLDWKNGQGKWILEAYQQIAGMEKEDNRLAALLMERGFQ